MKRNARVVATYFGHKLMQEWDRAVEQMLTITFKGAVVATGSGFDCTSGGRDLCYEVKQSSGVDPVEVRKALRRFFRNRKITGARIEIYSDDLS
jgi:hypothetical protein